MSALPKTYRFYCFNLERAVVTADFVNATTDDEAIAKARDCSVGSKCEIWEGKRLVAQLRNERP